MYCYWKSAVKKMPQATITNSVWLLLLNGQLIFIVKFIFLNLFHWKCCVLCGPQTYIRLWKLRSGWYRKLSYPVPWKKLILVIIKLKIDFNSQSSPYFVLCSQVFNLGLALSIMVLHVLSQTYSFLQTHWNFYQPWCL